MTCWRNDEYGGYYSPEGTFRSVSAGWDLYCGVRADGSIICWGSLSMVVAAASDS